MEIPPSGKVEEVAERVTELEKAVAKFKGGSAPAWQPWVDALSKLLLPLFLFWLAFTFKDSVQQALEHRRLEVQSAEAIEKLLQTLHQEDLQALQAGAAALTLSAFGEAAIMPLVAALEFGSSNSETAARTGLFMLGLSHPEAVTRSLSIVLSKRQGQFHRKTHQACIEILGKIAHPDSREALLAYRPLLEKPRAEGLEGWRQAVRDATKEEYENTREMLAAALAMVEIQWKPSASQEE